MVCFYFFESRNFLPKGLGLGFLTSISVSRRVSDFTICHPLCDIENIIFSCISQDLLRTHTKFVKKLEKGCANGGIEISPVFLEFVSIGTIKLLFKYIKNKLLLLVPTVYNVYICSLQLHVRNFFSVERWTPQVWKILYKDAGSSNICKLICMRYGWLK